MPFKTAKAYIIPMSGSQFDPKAVDTFLREEIALQEMARLAFQTKAHDAVAD